jgi:hypothetical protein
VDDSLPLSLEPRELLLSLDEPLRCRCRCRSCSCSCSCLGTAKPPPVRCTAASKLLARSDDADCLRGEEEEERRGGFWRGGMPAALDAEAMMDRALRRAAEESSGLAALLLPLVQEDDSTTFGMMKAGVDTGARRREGLEEGRELLLPRLGSCGGAGEWSMLSGERSPPPRPEDPLSVAGGDCRPPWERGRSRSSSPLRACCACERGGGGAVGLWRSSA